MKRSSDALWVSRLLPRLEPFRTIRQVEDSVSPCAKVAGLPRADDETPILTRPGPPFTWSPFGQTTS